MLDAFHSLLPLKEINPDEMKSDEMNFTNNNYKEKWKKTLFSYEMDESSCLLHKTCPVGSLLSLLSVRMSQVTGNISGVVLLWDAFVKMLRSRWEDKKYIPLLGIIVNEMGEEVEGFTYSPDSFRPRKKYSILYQHLQLLNYCIYKHYHDKDKSKDDDDDDDLNDSYLSADEGEEGIKR